MATIDSQSVIADIIAGKYSEDRWVKIVRYTNAWGSTAYGCIAEGQPLDMYAASEYVIDPETYWEAPKGNHNIKYK